MVSVYRAQQHNVALHPDDLHHVKVWWQGTCKTLAELTPPECRAMCEHLLSAKQARELLDGMPGWDLWSTWFITNELAQRGKLKAVLA